MAFETCIAWAIRTGVSPSPVRIKWFSVGKWDGCSPFGNSRAMKARLDWSMMAICEKSTK